MRVIVHRAAVAGMMQPAGEIGRAAARAAGKVRDRAKRYAPVDNGLLRNSIFSNLESQGLYSVVWRVGTPIEYGLYQELGTGPIFARRAPILTFRVGGKWVSTYATRGVPPVRYLTRAIERTSVEDFGF